MMKMKLAALAVAGLALTPLTAFAQSAPAPINQTGPGVTPPVSSSTDMGIAGQSGNTWATPGGAVPGPRYYRGPGAYAAYGAPGVGYGAPSVSYGYAGEY